MVGQRNAFLLFAGLLLLCSRLSSAASISEVEFPTAKSCVAWKTEKTFAFVRTITVVGMNCEINAQVIPEPDSHFHMEISIPISEFESGEDERDREVAQMLRADVSKTMEFVSSSIPLSQWREKVFAGEFDLPGNLKIGNDEYKISISISKVADGSLFVGQHKSKFKKFDIEPPTLLAGIGVRVAKDLELLFQLNPNDVLGSQSILVGGPE